MRDFLVLVSAEITPSGVGIGQRLHSMFPFSNCCDSTFSAIPSKYWEREKKIQNFRCVCGSLVVEIKAPNRVSYVDVTSQHAADYIEEWTGLRGIEIEVK